MSNEEKKANSILEILNDNGFEAYIVGGAARDILLGKKPSDYDIVTNATYDELVVLFESHKISVVGSSFEVCLIEGIEVATFRKDISQNQEDIPGTIYDDLKKRDLTINAMAINTYNGDFIDISGGKSDLHDKIIRFNGSAKDRILEDPCRIIRACRFLAKIEGQFSRDTFANLKKYSKLAHKIAPERIRLEILKAMEERKPSLFFDALYEIELLDHISPGFNCCYKLDGGPYHDETVDTHIKIAGDYITKKNPLLRLTAFYHDHGKPYTFSHKDDGSVSFLKHEIIGADIVESELEKLKFSLKEISYVRDLVKFHMRSIDENTKNRSVRKFLRDLKDHKVSWKDWLRLKIADRKANLKKPDFTKSEIKIIVSKIYNEISSKSHPRAFSIKDLKINGKDVMEIFKINGGPFVGEIMDKTLEYVLDDPSKNEYEILRKFIQDLKNNQDSKFAKKNKIVI